MAISTAESSGGELDGDVDPRRLAAGLVQRTLEQRARRSTIGDSHDEPQRLRARIEGGVADEQSRAAARHVGVVGAPAAGGHLSSLPIEHERLARIARRSARLEQGGPGELGGVAVARHANERGAARAEPDGRAHRQAEREAEDSGDRLPPTIDPIEPTPRLKSAVTSTTRSVSGVAPPEESRSADATSQIAPATNAPSQNPASRAADVIHARRSRCTDRFRAARREARSWSDARRSTAYPRPRCDSLSRGLLRGPRCPDGLG